MENFIKIKAKLNEEQINELLYYYKQGINMGKEETTLYFINNLIKENIDSAVIKRIANISDFDLEQFQG